MSAPHSFILETSPTHPWSNFSQSAASTEMPTSLRHADSQPEPLKPKTGAKQCTGQGRTVSADALGVHSPLHSSDSNIFSFNGTALLHLPLVLSLSLLHPTLAPQQLQ